MEIWANLDRPYAPAHFPVPKIMCPYGNDLPFTDSAPRRAYPLEIDLWDSAIVVTNRNALSVQIGGRNQNDCSLITQTGSRCWDVDATIMMSAERDILLRPPNIPRAHE